MRRLALTPASIAEEMAVFAREVAAGLRNLRHMGGVSPGATTPREALWQAEGVIMYRYRPSAQAPGTPLLLIYALVNRPDMVDLEPGRSVVEALLGNGFDVYLLDWGCPRIVDSALGLDDYVNRYLDAAVDFLRARLGLTALSMLGICQGGTLALCYAALNPHKVERLAITVTPVDFHTPEDLLSSLIRHVDVDALIDASGNVSGDVLNALFLALKPYQLLQQKYVRFAEQLSDPAATATFLRMEHWIFDSPMLAARAAREFARDFYQGNKLIRGGLTIGGRNVEPGRLSMPILNIFARADHLVPPAASRALGKLIVHEAYVERELPGGHIGIYVGGSARQGVAATLKDWMEGRLQSG